MRWRTRPATARRYSAVERTSSIGAISAASVAAASAATSAVGGQPSSAASVARARIGVGATEPSGDPDVPPERRPAPAPGDREHDHADRLRPPRPDLAEGDRAARGGSGMRIAEDQLVGGQRRPPVGREERRRGDGPLAARAADDDLRVEREQDRQAVAGRRGGRDVAAEGAAVLDLGRPDLRRPSRRGRGRAPRRGRCGAAPRTSWRRRGRGRRPPAGSRAAPPSAARSR